MGRIEVELRTVLDFNNDLSTWVDLEAGDSDSKECLQAKEDQRDSSFESPSSANHSHGSPAGPTHSISPKEKGSLRKTR
ncbi:unnamed protein product [Cyprideis torosa]|uniref:Uncharacterized protein n=1 Tax=Cyprideis torosa TaxID=163714 RepID=A0A7R8ZRX9_9CRUS|nr:unnamed protein product [Cyprideis torosa]CAG0894230.1 unnamed protein product [Cyprideis torosa]